MHLTYLLTFLLTYLLTSYTHGWATVERESTIHEEKNHYHDAKKAIEKNKERPQFKTQKNLFFYFEN